MLQEQYVFIYKALAEWYMFGETDIEVDQFREHYCALNEPQQRDQHSSPNLATTIAAAVKRSTPKLQRANGEASSLDKAPTAMKAEYKVGVEF